MKRKILWIAAAVFAVILPVCLLLLLPKADNSPAPAPTKPTAASLAVSIAEQEELSVNLGHGLYVTEVGSYTGPFVEDGSDEPIAGVLMLKVANRGEAAIEYGVITLPVAQGQAEFTLSALLPGQTVVLLEQNRLPWSSQEQYLYPLLHDTVYYTQPLDLQEDRLSLQLLEGGMNVTNISGQDITGEIVIYYKNMQQGLYYGGITYRLRISTGLKAGESCQLVSSHLHKTATQILFLTVD